MKYAFTVITFFFFFFAILSLGRCELIPPCIHLTYFWSQTRLLQVVTDSLMGEAWSRALWGSKQT